jgi:hypothetical protein
VRIIVIEEPGRRPVNLLTADPIAPAVEIVERYAARWAIEVAIFDAKQTTGAGQARNRTSQAVERTVPFTLYIQSVVIAWYHLYGHSPAVTANRRRQAPWYRAKTHPSYTGMVTRLRRALDRAEYLASPPGPQARNQPVHAAVT